MSEPQQPTPSQIVAAFDPEAVAFIVVHVSEGQVACTVYGAGQGYDEAVNLLERANSRIDQNEAKDEREGP